MRSFPVLVVLGVVVLAGLLCWVVSRMMHGKPPREELRSFVPIVREGEEEGEESARLYGQEARQGSAGGPKETIARAADPMGRRPLPEWKAWVVGWGADPVSPALVRDGPLHAADLCFPTSVAVGPKGEIYVAEPHSTLIRVIAGERVSTLVPTVAKGEAESAVPLAFERPARVAVRGQSLYVLEDVPWSSHPAIRVDEEDRDVHWLSRPRMPGYVRSRVWKVDLRSREATLVTSSQPRAEHPRAGGTLGLSLDYAWGMSSATEDGVMLFLRDPGELVLAVSGKPPRKQLRLGRTDRERLRRVREEGIAPYFASWDMVLLPDGRVALAHGSIVALLDRRGRLNVLAGDPAESGYRDGKGKEARFRDAAGIDWDPRRQALVVADCGNNVIRGVTLDGQVTTIAGIDGGSEARRFSFPGEGKGTYFCMPTDVCVTTDGDILVADAGYCLVRKIGPDGFTTTLAGTGRQYIVPVPFPGWQGAGIQ